MFYYLFFLDTDWCRNIRFLFIQFNKMPLVIISGFNNFKGLSFRNYLYDIVRIYFICGSIFAFVTCTSINWFLAFSTKTFVTIYRYRANMNISGTTPLNKNSPMVGRYNATNYIPLMKFRKFIDMIINYSIDSWIQTKDIFFRFN